MLTSQGQTVRLSESIIDGLVDAYNDLHEHIHRDEQYNNYFGLRDYYSLIKGVIQDAIQTQEDPYVCVRRQLSVDFDGIVDGSRYIYASSKFKTLLDQCLTRRTGRYLMLIAEKESVIDYVERYIIAHHQSQPVRILIGSCSPGDLISGTTYTEQYNYRVLMDIILYVERNTRLVLHRMGHLYDDLYDLFNQNFAVSAGKIFCHIPLGPLYHSRCLVNDDFYCVVFVQRQDLPKCDPPFLNRFEKHIIDMDNLVHPHQKAITSDLLVWLAELLSSNTNKHFPLLQHLFINYNFDYICNLVIDAFDHLNIPTDNDKEIIHPFIHQYCDIHEHLSVSSIIKKAMAVKQMAIQNQVVYTYTQLHDMINFGEESKNVEEIKLSHFKLELELMKKICLHYKPTTQARLLLIRVDYHFEQKHILCLKYILYNHRVDTSDQGVWIVFHLQRNLLNQVTNDVLFNGWDIVMIEDLNEHKLIPQEILINPSYLQLIADDRFRFDECTFDERINRCFTKFRYIVSCKQYEHHINDRLDYLLLSIKIENSSLRSIIQSHLQILQTTVQSNSQDWQRDLLYNEIVIELPLIFYLRLPCARVEYENIRRIRELLIEMPQDYNDMSADNNDNILDKFSINQLRNKSIYKQNFEIIINDVNLLKHFYHDQISLALDEAKLYQLSTSFVLKLLTSNPTRSPIDLLKHLLDNHTELIELLRMFEAGLELVNEKKLSSEIFQQQFITSNNTSAAPINNPSDPFIEISLMNLIELIISPSSIGNVKNIEQQACRRSNYDVNYATCDEIHNFINDLGEMINSNLEEINNINIVHDPLVKLEIEFMKNWLVDHGDQTNEQIPQYGDEMEQFDQYLNQLNDPTRKIERLMVNRIHMHLILDVHEDKVIEAILRKDFVRFKERIQQLVNEQSDHGSTLIGLTAWLKYYAQLYALALNNDKKAEVMNNIDQLLTRDNSQFCSTLKLFVTKQLCQFFKITLKELRDIFINRTCTWIRQMITKPNGQLAQEIRPNIILPTPLFQFHKEFMRINQILSH
ncbi:unnamed protein product, partial [Didymodactylos carnosus]